MMTPSITLPEYRKRVSQFEDEEWYSWDEFTEMATKIAGKLGPESTRMVGTKIVTQAKEIYTSQGFNSADAIFRDFYKMFEDNVKGAPETDPPRTVSYAPGSVTIRAGMVQPAKLIEGYLVGIVRMFGHRLLACDYSVVDLGGIKLHNYEVKWSRPDESFGPNP